MKGLDVRDVQADFSTASSLSAVTTRASFTLRLFKILTISLVLGCSRLSSSRTSEVPRLHLGGQGRLQGQPPYFLGRSNCSPWDGVRTQPPPAAPDGGSGWNRAGPSGAPFGARASCRRPRTSLRVFGIVGTPALAGKLHPTTASCRTGPCTGTPKISSFSSISPILFAVCIIQGYCRHAINPPSLDAGPVP